MVTTFDNITPAALNSVSYPYKYPDELDLKPGSKLHNFIKDRVLQRARLAYQRIKHRHDSWREMDKTMNGFIWADDAERLIKRSDPRKPISIVVPMTYATNQTRMTYFANTFLVYPYYRYAPLGLTTRLSALLLERVVDQQMQTSGAGLALLTQYRDNSLYGIGATANFWCKKSGYKLSPTVPGGVIRDTVWEGNTLVNINPYFLLLDPRPSIHNFQQGEFVGWVATDNYLNMLSKENDAEGYIFNAKYLKHTNRINTIYPVDPSERDRDRVAGLGYEYQDREARPVNNVYMYIKIIPQEWGVGKETYPQTWLFCLSNEQIITQANEVKQTHNMFPVSIMASGYTGYDIAPVAPLEINFGLQEVMNFQLNSHVANMRKAVNDRIVIDPSVVNQADVVNNKPGGIIRARRSNFGSDIRQSIFQLQITDVTRNNISDLMTMWGINERSSGITGQLQGMTRNSSDRVTAAEINSTQGNGLDRLACEFKIIGMQAYTPTAIILAKQTQQYMSQETFVAIAGRDEVFLKNSFPSQESVPVTLADINVDFDVVPQDMRSLRQLDQNVALQLFQAASQNQNLAAEYDIGQLFSDLTTRMGDPELTLYRRQQGTQMINNTAQVQPDQQVQQQVQAGNLVPMETLQQ